MNDENKTKEQLLEEIRNLRQRLGESESSVRAVKERFRETFEQAAIGLCHVSPDWRFLRVNDKLCEILGHGREDLLEMTVRDITHPDDIGLSANTGNRLLDGKIAFSHFEKRYIRKDGTVVWGRLSIKLVRSASGEPQYYITAIEDITQYKRFENFHKIAKHVLELLNESNGEINVISRILDTIKQMTEFEAVGIRLKDGDDFPYYETSGFPESFVRAETYLCERDRDGRIVRDPLGNPNLECMCGNILRGKTDPALPFFTKGGSFWTNSTSELLASTTETDRQTRTRNRCNDEGYESVALIPIKTGKQIIGLLQFNDKRNGMFTPDFIRFFEDLVHSFGITIERKKAEDKLREAHDDLEKKVRKRTTELREKQAQLVHAGRLAALGEMATGIAHELNQPLAIINLYGESLLYQKRKSDSPHDFKDTGNAILRSVERASNIINHMRKFAHPGKARLEEIDPVAPAENGLLFFSEQFRNHGIELETDFGENLPKVRADAQLLEQIIANLLSNARYAVEKKTAENRKHVRLGISHGKDENTVIFEVADNGIGMTPGEREKCLEPFFTTKDVGEGTGIGLSIVHGIVRQLNGKLEIQSEKDKGTAIRIVLPLCKKEPTPPARGPCTPPARGPCTPPARGPCTPHDSATVLKHTQRKRET